MASRVPIVPIWIGGHHIRTYANRTGPAAQGRGPRFGQGGAGDSAILTGAAAAFALLCTAGVGCGPAAFPPAPPQPAGLPPAEAVVYLIGDAGASPVRSRVLNHLKAEAAERSRNAEVVVAFLGDNIYELGLREPSHPGRQADVRHLEAQIHVVRGTAATGVFVPGNHDWGGGSGPGGLETVRRQGAYLAAVAREGVNVAQLPPDGCPRPALMPIPGSVLLVFIDTQWRLRYGDGVTQNPDCRNGSPEEVVSSLRGALRRNATGEGRRVIVLAHHPLETYGPHGGYFGLKDQFFPATNLWKPLYIPIPFIYAIVRNSGVSNQDLSAPKNRRMRQELASVFSELSDHPLVYAAGHDHGLQVYDGREYGVRYILVSGAGSKLTNIGNSNALFAAGTQQGELGYMRLEFLTDGRVLLSVITDGTRSCEDRKAEDCLGQPTVRYWRWLTDESP